MYSIGNLMLFQTDNNYFSAKNESKPCIRKKSILIPSKVTLHRENLDRIGPNFDCGLRLKEKIAQNF